MASVSSLHLFAAFGAAFLAGAINSVAGGGSLISFPVLIALGLPPLFANATNTVGIWPGALGSVWGFREEFARVPRFYHWLLLPAVIGSAAGAVLLRFTSPETFDRIVPGLILGSTVLFIIAPKVRAKLAKGKVEGARLSPGHVAGVFVLQTLISLYGGYFGAGMSILMLTALSLLGMTDMLEMTAMTSFLSLAINGVAGLVFGFGGIVAWPYAAAMAVGAIVGGYGAAGIARKVGKDWIRRLVITVGLGMTVVMLARLW